MFHFIYNIDVELFIWSLKQLSNLIVHDQIYLLQRIGRSAEYNYQGNIRFKRTKSSQHCPVRYFNFLRFDIFFRSLKTHWLIYRLLDVVYCEKKLFLVFEYLNQDLKKLMDSAPTPGLPIPLVKVGDLFLSSLR